MISLMSLRAHALALGALATLAATPASARSMTCQGFMDAFNTSAGEHRVTFSRALSVGGRESGYEYFDASGAGDVDVSVVCRNDRFVRVEVRSARGDAAERLQSAVVLDRTANGNRRRRHRAASPSGNTSARS